MFKNFFGRRFSGNAGHATKNTVPVMEKVSVEEAETATRSQNTVPIREVVPSLKERYKSDSMMIGFTLSTRDYGWEVTQTCPKILLSNTQECISNPSINAWNLMSCFRGTGHCEWECILAMFFMEALLEAEEKGKEADITSLFNRNFMASGNKTFSSAQVARHLERWFETVKCTDEGVGYLRFRGA